MPEPLKIGSQKQLFIDDYCVAESQGVRRQLNQPTKHPANPLIVPQNPWEATYTVVYGNVLKDPATGLYRMWYSARDKNRVNTVCHATSTDGVAWERSKLDIVAHEDIKQTNILMRGQFIGPTVFHTPNDPDPNRHYRMFVFMGPELLNDEVRETAFTNAYGVLFSPDGLHWTEYASNPVIQGGDISTCTYDPVVDEYFAFPKIYKQEGGIGRRCVGMSGSKDFLHWTTPVLMLSADTEDDARVEARLNRFRNIIAYDTNGAVPGYYGSDIYGMTGFRYEDLRLGLMWFYDRSGLRPPEHDGNDDGVINIQLAYQRGPHWYRAGDRQDFLPCGPEGSYDAGMVITSHNIVEVGDEIRFYYTGVDRSHNWQGSLNPTRPQPLTKTPWKGSSINLATLRRDGFISIDALYPEGSLTTKPLMFGGEKLEINADAERGHVLVEIGDENGKPIEGFAKADCVPFKEDAVHGAVAWKGGSSLAALQGKPVTVTFFVQTAKLYAFKFV